MASTLPGPSRGRMAAYRLAETPASVRLFLLKVVLFVSVWGALFFRGDWLPLRLLAGRLGPGRGGWPALPRPLPALCGGW